MKSKLFITLLVVLIATSMFSQREASTKENRELSSFNSISVGSGLDVYITQGDDQKIEVEAENDVIHRIITEVKGETLHVYVKGRFKWSFKQNRKVYVTVPEYKNITASAGSDVKSMNEIKSELLNVSSSGGADIYLEVKSTTLKLQCHGGADISVKGSTDNLTAQVSGGGDIDAKKMVAKYVEVNASGGGDAEVNATESLDANASGGGDIHYTGSPKKKKINESGGGDVTRF